MSVRTSIRSRLHRAFAEAGATMLESWRSGAVALALLAIALVPLLPLAPVSGHMAQHIAVMNVAALLCAVAMLPRGTRATSTLGPRGLWPLTALQMVLLWGWHAPQAHAAAASSPLVYAAMMTSLFVVALGFWHAVLLRAARSDWQPIFALLVTGKLACLLGALLVFSPRLIYAGAAPSLLESCISGSGGLDDQHLAGLLMLTACPLSYVLAGIVLAARILDRRSERAIVSGTATAAEAR